MLLESSISGFAIASEVGFISPNFRSFMHAQMITERTALDQASNLSSDLTTLHRERVENPEN
jgi:hypothetical protein